MVPSPRQASQAPSALNGGSPPASASRPGSPKPAPLEAPGAVDKLALLPLHSLGYLPEQRTALASAPPPQKTDGHASRNVLKSFLLLFGLLSVAQFALAIALFARPVQLNIERQYGTSGRLLSFLPAVASVTTKAPDGWLAAAVAVVGVLAWERHLRKKGTSLDDMDAWGALLAADVPGTLVNAVKLGLAPVAAFVAVVGVTAAASAAVVGALTPTAGPITVQQTFNAPSLFASDPNRIGLACEPNVGTACRQSLGRGFVFDALNSVPLRLAGVSLGGYRVATSAIGIANPGVAQAYVAESRVRAGQYASGRSWIQTIMCMEGLAASPNCTIVARGQASRTPLSGPAPASNSSPSWTLAYTNACGQSVTSSPLCCNPAGTMDASACFDGQNEAHVDWLLLGSFVGGNSTVDSSVQIQCALDLAPAARAVNLSREEGVTTLAFSGEPRACPLTSNPIDIVSNITSQVGAVLTDLRDPDGGLLPISALPDDVDALSYLELVTGTLFRAMYTWNTFEAVEYVNNSSDDADVLNYGGGGTPAYPVTADEKYLVLLVGDGSRAWLIPLTLAMALIIGSFATLPRRLLAFDPSHTGAAVAVALRSDVRLAAGGEGGLATEEEAGRRMWFGEKEGEPGKLTVGLEHRVIVGRKESIKGGDLLDTTGM